jgi:lipid A 4'-phosphatase
MTKLRTLMINFLKRPDWLYLGLSLLIFYVWPDLDLSISDFFYSAEDHFFLKDLYWVQMSYWLFAKLPWVLIPLLTMFWLLAEQKTTSRKALFLLMSILLGPGLLVNGLAKENMGRARPVAIEQYGGSQQFTGPLQVAQECEHNCSFTSGHAAMAYAVIGLAWALQRRYLFWLGIFVGSLAGFGRILQGGHFFSDVLFSFWITYFSTLLIAKIFNLELRIPSSTKPISIGPVLVGA